MATDAFEEALDDLRPIVVTKDQLLDIVKKLRAEYVLPSHSMEEVAMELAASDLVPSGVARITKRDWSEAFDRALGGMGAEPGSAGVKGIKQEGLLKLETLRSAMASPGTKKELG